MISGIQKLFKLFGPTVSSTKIVTLVAPFFSGCVSPTNQDSMQTGSSDASVSKEIYKKRLRAMLLAPIWQLNIGDDMRAKSKLTLP